MRWPRLQLVWCATEKRKKKNRWRFKKTWHTLRAKLRNSKTTVNCHICVTVQPCNNKGRGSGDTIFVSAVQLMKLSFPPQSTLSDQSDHVMTKCWQQDLHYTVHSTCSLLLIIKLRRLNTASVFLKTNEMRQLKYNRKGYKTHFISGANFYNCRHQGAITRKFINNESSYVQQVFKALFALISTIRVISLKMLQLHITQQHIVAATTTTTTRSDQTPLSHNHSHFFFLAVHTNIPINTRSKGISIWKVAHQQVYVHNEHRALSLQSMYKGHKQPLKILHKITAAFLETYSGKSCGERGR